MKANEIKPYSRKAYYYETDKMGIVHHSNYIRWLEETRIDMLFQAGYPFERMESEGVMIPVLSVDCSYKYPVRFDEIFEVHPKVTYFNGCRLVVEYTVINVTAGGKVSAICRTEHCLTDETMRPLRTQKKHTGIFNVFKDAVSGGTE